MLRRFERIAVRRGTKLSVEQVIEARLMVALGEDIGFLAREFGVHHETVRRAVAGETFKTVPYPPIPLSTLL